MTVANAMPSWTDLIGLDQVRAGFKAAIEQNRLGGSFLVTGPHGTGKHTFVELLARTLLCRLSSPEKMSPCGHCESCQQVAAGTHPDVIRVSKPKDKATIPLASFIGDSDVRMQEGFCHDVRIRPLMGGWKVAVIDDADFLNEEGANCLLKTLEEPPKKTIILLIAISEQRQLPTIRSRCQTVRIGPLSLDASSRLLREIQGVQADDSVIKEAVEVSGGDLHAALRLLQGESDKLRQSLIQRLQAPQPDPIAITKIFNEHIGEAGKEASKRRAALRDLLSISVQHFRQQMRHEAFENHQTRSITLARLDRSVRALREVDRSANQASLVECFAADIAIGQTGDRGEIG
jgi:DNA polymerase-3 subunit delta'